jgi:hypothetical protein
LNCSFRFSIFGVLDGIQYDTGVRKSNMFVGNLKMMQEGIHVDLKHVLLNGYDLFPSFAAGMLQAMMRGLPENECVSAGFYAAAWSLQSPSAVPENIPHASIPVRAEFTPIHS